MQQQLRVLAVIAIELDKSILFMLPAAVSPGSVTVVIALLNSL
jgi:superfamily II DNA helicase RecQ